MMRVSQCAYCVHAFPKKEGQGMSCAAFPEGVPGEISFGIHDHANPYPGDNGIRFKLREDARDLWERYFGDSAGNDE